MILQLDGSGALFQQLARALKTRILDGSYPAGGWLPATRTLATTLGVSRNTVLAAYELLCAEQLAVAHPGTGTQITRATGTQRSTTRPQSIAPQSRYSARARKLEAVTLAGGRAGHYRYDLQYGAPQVRPELFMSWRRRQAAAVARGGTHYPPAEGLPALRSAIVDYLLRRRGVTCSSEDVIVVGGTQQGLTLTARILIDEGQTAVIEDPHYQYAHHALIAHGARVIPVRVDRDGLVTRALPSRPPRLIVVTPSQQFPSGEVMSFQRRVELLNYAVEHNCWIFEDDYDGEYHYDARPIPALRSLDMGERVIYSGTFSKTLFPGLRLGYIVCPRVLREDMARAKNFDDLGCASIEQAALAAFLTSRHYERHLRKSLVELRARRSAILGGLSQHLSEHIERTTSNGGMHVVVWFKSMSYPQLERLLAYAKDNGLGLYPIHPYYAKRPPRPGLMLGLASLPPTDLMAAMALLGECVRRIVGRDRLRSLSSRGRGSTM
jgi:GntR family transcriptional regulator / MocR family aminotransferase